MRWRLCVVLLALSKFTLPDSNYIFTGILKNNFSHGVPPKSSCQPLHPSQIQIFDYQRVATPHGVSH